MENNELEEKPQTCCLCIEVNTGMKLIGGVTILSSIIMFTQGIIMILKGHYIGLLNFLPNFIVIILAYWFFEWFRADTRLNRRNITAGFKYNLIFSTCSLFVMVITVRFMPISYIPDEFPGREVKRMKLNKEMKLKIKQGLFIVLLMLLIINFFTQAYFYNVAVKWSTMPSLLGNAK